MREYAEGQVWQYRTRRGEERSLIKIQRIEPDLDAGEPVFHISIIGLKSPHFETLQHAPVSKQTLDTSVTTLADDFGQFPSADEGIAEWKRANGGVYSVGIAEIVELADFKPA